MRKQLIETVEKLLADDERLVLLLGDIGVFGFRHAFKKFSNRVYNIGILEQATVSLAAGLSMVNCIPVVHTIAPFLIERSLEQLKIDFCYQGLGGNFVSVGGSYDYAALGCTHHCPGDVGILNNLPGMEIVIPGTAEEFNHLFCQSYANQHPTYFRLSERDNPFSCDVTFGEATVIQKGSLATVIAVGTTLKPVMEAVDDLDVSILYYTTLQPFDEETLKKHCTSSRILLCEPCYKGTSISKIIDALCPKPIRVDCLGVPLEFLTNYGTVEEHDRYVGLTPSNIRLHLERLIYAES